MTRALSVSCFLLTGLLAGCSGPYGGVTPPPVVTPADGGETPVDGGQTSTDGGAISADGGTTGVSACASPVVWLRTGTDRNCGGQNTHAWPVGLKATDCHGWRAVDNTGRQHDNSASAIKCEADGSFSFVQYAGNLHCSGTGTRKDYVLSTCEQDTPPSLYTIAFDLTCCSRPADPACKIAVPSVSVAGGSVFLNGTVCTP